MLATPRIRLAAKLTRGRAYLALAYLALACLALACEEEHQQDYDPEQDCDERLACAEERGLSVPSEERKRCEKESQAQYDGASRASQDALDEAFVTCMDETACEYTACLGETLGIHSDPTCVAELSETEGELELPDRVLPYADTGVRFWVNRSGCLSGVDIQLRSGECNVTIRAQDLVDADGRFLITDVSVTGAGECPDWPTDLDEMYATAEDSEDTFGTIEVSRPEDVSWFSCVAGELAVRLDVVLAGSAGVDLDLSGIALDFTGLLQRTHISSSDDCAAAP